jgi:hypothetical protein
VCVCVCVCVCGCALPYLPAQHSTSRNASRVSDIVPSLTHSTSTVHSSPSRAHTTCDVSQGWGADTEDDGAGLTQEEIDEVLSQVNKLPHTAQPKAKMTCLITTPLFTNPAAAAVGQTVEEEDSEVRQVLPPTHRLFVLRLFSRPM